MERSTSLVLSSIVEDVGAEFDNLRTISEYLSYTPWVQRMIVPDRIWGNRGLLDPLGVRDYLSELSNYRHINGFAASLAVYFNETAQAFTSEGSLDDLSWLAGHSYKIDGWGPATWKGLLDERHSGSVIGPELLRSYHRRYDCLLYLHTLSSASARPVATFLAVVDMSRVEAIIRKHIGSSSGAALVSATHGLLCTATDDFQFPEQFEESDWTSIGHGTRLGSAVVSARSLGIRDFTILVAVPRRDIQIRYYTDRYLVVLLIIVMIVAGLFVVQRFAFENYRPVRYAVGILKEQMFRDEEPPTGDDYDALVRGVDYIVSKEDDLEQRIGILQNERREALLLRIAKGDLDAHRSGIPFFEPFFTAAIVSFVRRRNLSSGLLSELCRRVLQTPLVHYHCARISSTEYLVLANTANRGVADSAKAIAHDVLGRYRGRYVARVSVGGTYDSADALARSYQDALYAREYELVTDTATVTDYEKLPIQAHTLYHYPLDTERKIANYLDMGDESSAGNVLREVFERNRNTQHLSVFTAKCLFYNMLSTILKVVNRQRLSHEVALDENRLRAIHSLDEMERFMIEAYGNLARAIRANKESSNFALRAEIVEYLDNHFSDRNISVLTVAEHFGISSTYLSRFFKDQTGFGFGETLRSRRVEKAKQLLREGMSVAAASTTVGYSDETALRRAFKRSEGITPGEYKRGACAAKRRALAVTSGGRTQSNRFPNSS